ncbi:hypothetical protein [Streptomyces sp. NPDC059533]|uniref:hypothetical protein n=1 Tax=unclassified Streptomyces TaxID=2593676 RepID=UPI00368C0BE0
MQTSAHPLAVRTVRSGPIGMPVAAARAAVFAGSNGALAITGHHLASGCTVPPVAAVVPLAVLFLLALPLSQGRRSRAGVVAVTGLGQAVLHFWLAGAARQVPGMHVHGVQNADQAWHSGHHGPAMTAVHAIVALLVAWFLHAADAAICAAAERIGDALGGLLGGRGPAAPRPVRPFAAPRVYAGPERSAHPRARLLAHALSRRGPPGRRSSPAS